jgi:environmental stress-induced protein Ves
VLLKPMSLQRFNVADLPAMPWKNGGGVTREIVCQPSGADMGSFDWRVSIAHIASDGPFSSFVGIDRVITLLSGSGVQLHGDGGQVDHCLDTPWVPFAFAGEAAIQARLLAGDCHDFNVMTRRAVCSASLQVLRSACDWPVASQGLLMAVQGSWKLEGPSTLTLLPQEGVWWSDADTAWRLRPQSPDAALLALKISH